MVVKNGDLVDLPFMIKYLGFIKNINSPYFRQEIDPEISKAFVEKLNEDGAINRIHDS